jgi:hypothetical protein
VSSRMSVASDDSSVGQSPLAGAAGDELQPTESPETPVQLRQLMFDGDAISSPSEDEGEDDEAAAVDMVAPTSSQLQIHLFPTYATQLETGVWQINVHGWCVRLPSCAAPRFRCY